MGRDDPELFEATQFTIEDVDHDSQSSQTESLLGRANSPPPNSHTNDVPYQDSADDTEKDDVHYPPAKRRAHAGGTAIHIPTRAEVEAGLLLSKTKKRPGAEYRNTVIVGLVLMLIGAWGISQLLALGTRFGHGGPKINVILMVSDGMGPASETMGRSFLQYLHDAASTTEGRSLLNQSIWSSLESGFVGREMGMFGIMPLDEMLVGTSRTRSSNSLVTDSAAGATAFASALHTYNGAIGVSPAKTPVGTVLEAAHRQGFSTGLVTTSRITHATPAAFYAHVVDRDLESDIASFLIGDGPQGQVVDIALGGGRCFFRANSTTDSCRTDDVDMFAKAKANGITVLDGMKALNDWHDDKGHDKPEPVLGLFHDSHMDFEIDREQITLSSDEQPTLKQMVHHAIQHLEKFDDKGFFLMVEGARIDMAGHNNDPVGHISDMLAYHSTVAYLKDYVANANEDGMKTILISVSDHETGGLALGRTLGTAYPEYAWYPEVLVNATHSTEYLGAQVAKEATSKSYLRSEIFEKGLGIVDISDDEVDGLWKVRTSAYRSNLFLADCISRRAQVGWSTVGHSGVDVNLYAWGFNSTGIAGNRENIEIGEHIAHSMGLNLDVVTLELNKKLDWFSDDAGHSLSRTTHVNHYHGEF
ncbi:hypothetical protein MNV49_003685 [Pseudohyphozyma bogoriensis]|nr:hypothetical protein MNV49_003685 [Pseudohyphozyma bogoriensis]